MRRVTVIIIKKNLIDIDDNPATKQSKSSGKNGNKKKSILSTYQEKQIYIHVSGCMDLETSKLKPPTCWGQAVPPVEVASVNARFQGAHDGVCLQLNVAFKQPLVQIFE